MNALETTPELAIESPEILLPPKLYIFDLDGTLIQYKTWQLLPNVKETILALPQETKLAICSNQGGVGLRNWMEEEQFGDPDKYPTEEEILEKTKALFDQIGRPFAFYFSFAYQSNRTQLWNPIRRDDETAYPKFWQKSWRKPQAGMLIAAMEDAGVSPEETVMVGDWSEDCLAAAAANCNFVWDYEYFNRPRTQTE